MHIRNKRLYLLLFFFFNDTATTKIYTLSLHAAFPFFAKFAPPVTGTGMSTYAGSSPWAAARTYTGFWRDRKSTRLNSSHVNISYAVFCLKKKTREPLYTSVDLVDMSTTNARVYCAHTH